MIKRRRTERILLALVIGLAGTVTAAADTEEGGGRSVFADGAGNRALALGGAYAAVADDASAPVWNPGGLGFVQRIELQATHTDLIGFGFSEQYGSLVLPDWKFGVFAITYRHFGVGGIEERDARNALLSDDLSDRETDLALSYGRQLGPAWSLGGTFKVRGHRLAGYSDNGVGMDLGLMVRPLVAAGSTLSWAEDVNLGFAVRNAVEPTLRLDQDAVPDPRGFRTGLAYRRSLGRQGHLLTALDVEKTRQMDARLHAGIEAQFLPIVTMRVGFNDGTLVAGTGIRWQDYGIDYVFEDLNPTNIHRIGLSINFGATREERRLASLAREEESLRRRLDEALVENTRRRTAELILQTETALREGDLEQASSSLAMLKVIEPNNTRLQPLEISLLIAEARRLEAEGDYAGAVVALGRVLNLDPDDELAANLLARVRTASDSAAARSAEMRARLDRAMDDFAAGRLLAARRGFETILAANPRDEEAAAMLRRTDEAVERRTNELITQVRLLAIAGNFAAAQATLAEARELAPESPEVDTATRFLADKKLTASLKPTKPASRPDRTRDRESGEFDLTVATESAGQAAAGATRPTLSAQRREEIAVLYRRGMEAVDHGNLDEALHYWEIVWAADPDFQKVTEYLKQQYLARGMEAFVAGHLEGAIASWENAVRVDPTDERAQGYLARANEQLNRMQQIESGTR